MNNIKGNHMDPRDKLDSYNQKKLDELVAATTKHRQAYKDTKNPQIAQIWLALLEIYKRQEKMQESIANLERAINTKPTRKKRQSPILRDLKNY